MAYHTVNLPSIVLTTSGSPSTGNALTDLTDIYAISIIGPATLTGTVSIQVEPTSSGTTYATLQSGGVDVTVAAARAIVIAPFPYKQITLVSTATEDSPRTFRLAKTFLT